MARGDWFRQTDWNEEIEAAFFAKLRRAREKQQYLRIQASTIAGRKPEVALRLLDEYFALGDHFDQAQAHADRASAYLALRDTKHAIAALEAALGREEQYPRLQTYAHLDLPFLIASQRIESRYEQALELLERYRARLTFPVDHFRWHAAYALILSAQAQTSSAREHARLALAAAAKDHSGFRYHPSVGLVGTKYEDIRHQLSVAAA